MNVNFSIVPDPPQTTFGDSIVPPAAPQQDEKHVQATPESNTVVPDTTMEDATHDQKGEQGTKRALEEDEEYD